MVSLFATKVLVDTASANQWVSNLFLLLMILTLIEYLLKKLFGITTPYMHYLVKWIKFNKVLAAADNPFSLYQNFEELDKSINKKGLVETMKTIIKWLNANKITLTGMLASVLFMAELVFEVSTKFNLDQEWYYTLTAVVLIIINIAVSGRGFESIEQFAKVKEIAAKIKQDKQVQKKLKQAAELKQLMDLMNKPTEANTEDVRYKR